MWEEWGCNFESKKRKTNATTRNDHCMSGSNMSLQLKHNDTEKISIHILPSNCARRSSNSLSNGRIVHAMALTWLASVAFLRGSAARSHCSHRQATRRVVEWVWELRESGRRVPHRPLCNRTLSILRLTRRPLAYPGSGVQPLLRSGSCLASARREWGKSLSLRRLAEHTVGGQEVRGHC